MRRNATLLVAAVAVLLAVPGGAAATERTAEPRIVGGIQSTAMWPAQGALHLNGSFRCGGTLVSGRWFLTAAHCVTNSSGNALASAGFTVRLGSLNRTTGGEVIALAPGGVIPHASYNENTIENDVALLRLATAPSSRAVQPLGLVRTDESSLWAPNTAARIIGWGLLCNDGCSFTPTVLREASAAMRSDAFCADPSSYGSDFKPGSMVCAGDGSTDTCEGDSGGPLMVPRVDAWVLVGVTSWGITCADSNYPGVYSRVGGTSLNGWIRDRVPTVTISPSAFGPKPAVGATVHLQAAADPGAHASPAPTFKWDLDDDGTFDDATGATAQLTAISAGSHAVKVRQIYPDNDCAIGREVITTIGATPPGPSAPKPFSTAPCSTQTQPPPPPPFVPPPPPPPPLAELLTLPKSIKLSSLLDRRMLVRVRCRGVCYVTSSLTLDAKTSRRVHLVRRRGHTKRIGTGDGERLIGGTLRVTIRLSRSTVKRLRRARGGSVVLRVQATDDDEQTRRFKKTIKLKR